MSQRALADLVGVEGPSMVSMLDRLERDGLVTRAPSTPPTAASSWST
jgi:MarR family transcriptional regulator for hemolysin